MYKRQFKDLAKRSDLMLYRIKRKRKLAYTGSSELLTSNTLINAGTSAEEKQQEEIFSHTKNYQDFSLKELCNIIDLLSPSTDGFLYMLDFRTDFFYISPQMCIRDRVKAFPSHHRIHEVLS